MLLRSVDEECCKEVMGVMGESVGEECRRRVLEKSVVEWLLRSVDEECCKEVMGESVGEECRRRVLEKSVVEKCWNRGRVPEKSAGEVPEKSAGEECC